MSHAEDFMKKSWLARVTKDVLKQFAEKTKVFEFAPLVCPTTLQDESQAAEAKTIVA